ncbi:YppC protein [Bacillus sp. JCM 19045]|nr:YppC protein [Bacillus sp. JCM 19045]
MEENTRSLEKLVKNEGNNGMNGLINYFNVDNIARTKAYENFGREHPEIRWARLAGMVSRNAGWNMTDLTTVEFQTLLHRAKRQQIGWIYERANWLIFEDAYPQLILYAKAKKDNRFSCDEFEKWHISRFMTEEWQRFWEERDENRLMQALIINEQYVVQTRLLDDIVMEGFFHSFFYKLEEFAHLSHVIFPSQAGLLYGETVTTFADPVARIKLGKRLASLLYHPDLSFSFMKFADSTEPIGTRKEYKKARAALPLRFVYPRYRHQESIKTDWYCKQNDAKIEALFSSVRIKPKIINELRTDAELQILCWLKQKTTK